MAAAQDIPETPYIPKITPVKDIVRFGKVDFHTAYFGVPEGVEYKGSILYVHGFAEFSSLYVKISDDLAQAGYESYFFDQRGSGFTSVGKFKGQTNEHYTFKDLERFIELRLELVKSKPNQKFYLFGHSMGGAIILNYTIMGKYRDQITGVLMTAPCIRLHSKSQPNVVLRVLHPYVAKLLPNVAFNSKLVLDYITSHKDWQSYLIAHPLSTPIGSFIMFQDFLQRGLKLLKPEYVKNERKDLPVLIVHGTADYICDIEGSRTFKRITPAEDFTLKEIEGGKHNLLIESDGIYNQTYEAVIAWLNSH